MITGLMFGGKVGNIQEHPAVTRTLLFCCLVYGINCIVDCGGNMVFVSQEAG
jgi:hypothetical protein